MPDFMFATGIENSYPVIAGGRRVDEMEKCGHYRRWRDDLALVRDMGLSHLRWGPALYQTFLAPGNFDWCWTDDVLAEMDRLGIAPILDLCHFGVPDWLGNFQNCDFAAYFAEYAGAFASRYQHVRLWTPVNEILITTLFSAKYGWWNERLTSDEAYVRATINVCRANLLGIRAIRKQVPQAIFVQCESCEVTHPSGPDVLDLGEFHNERRFLPLDLTCGRPVSPEMRNYLLANGMTEGEYDFFMNHGVRAGCVLGTDYYAMNEHVLYADGTTGPSGEVLGYYGLARQYYDRYGLPLMHTETNLREEDDSVRWLWKQWRCLLRLRQEGVPVLGFTWYSLTDQMDWDTALREDARRVNSVGLFDLNRNIRNVGEEYRRMIQCWSPSVDRVGKRVLPAGRMAA